MRDPLLRHSDAFPAGVTGVLTLLMLCPFSAGAQQRPVFYDPHKTRQAVRSTTPVPEARRKPIRASTIQDGKSCNLITFEGLGDLQSIPTFDGISSPGWLSIIENAWGGSGNFSNEPSFPTTAFWLDPTITKDILFAHPVSSVSLYYASLPGIGLTAYDADGNVVASAQGWPNYDDDNNTYDQFWPIGVDAVTNKISRLMVSGYVNETGIDNLYVCRVIGIDSVEVTQAIQQWQSLSDLKASLTASQEPPVPIISGKPAVFRVYMDQVDDVASITVRMSGVYSETKTWPLSPNCSTDAQRAQTGECTSIDFYFTPPSGDWQTKLEVIDSGGNVLQLQDLSFTSRDTASMLFRGVSICFGPENSFEPDGAWACAAASTVLGLLDHAAKIFPTKEVKPEVTNKKIKRDFNAGYASTAIWYQEVAKEVDSLFGVLDDWADSALSRRTTYVGFINNGVGEYCGMSGSVPPSTGHGLAIWDSCKWGGRDILSETLSHEAGHTLGLMHTATDIPRVINPNGCWALAQDDHNTDWTSVDLTKPGNYIQSSLRLEVGFDVAARKPLDPNGTFEVMGYCYPRWISPQRYKSAINILGGGNPITTPSSSPVQPSARPRPFAGTSLGPYWLVTGTISGANAQFDPLFQQTVQGNSDPGTGAYTLVEQSLAGQALFTRNLSPQTPQLETPDAFTTGLPHFTEQLPVLAGVAAIVLKDPANIELGRITLGGPTPVVAISVPAAGFTGTAKQKISWTVSGAASFTSKVLYSADNGTTWSSQGSLPNVTSMTVDFGELPGSNQALIQVLVSDGVNTGSATSPPFTVPRHTPTAVLINSPTDGFAQPAASTVHFTGNAFDLDDGMLSGTALKWSSDIQGTLGTGSPLDVKLQPGLHQITLTATDSDGNAITTHIGVSIGGQPPVLTLQVTDLDRVPTTCVNVVINATPGADGAGLSRVRYSLNAGLTYSDIPLTSLPFGFTVPGSGYFHLVASALDLSGQRAFADATFFTQSACKGGSPAIANLVPNTGHQGQILAKMTISGQNTHFTQGTTIADFGAGITVNSLTVISSILAVANITVAGNAAVGSRNVSMTTGAEVATGPGTFKVTAAYAVSASPINGGSAPGTALTFVFAYADAGGNIDLSQVSMLINSSVARANACSVTWVRSDNTIRLDNDADTGATYASATGTNTFGNSQCTISYNNAIVASGNNLTMTLSLTFATSFIGSKNIYMEAQGDTGGDTGLQLMGTWAVRWVPRLASLAPGFGHPGQSQFSVAITGQNSHFAQGLTVASFSDGITVNSLTVSSSTAATANVSIAGNAAAGTRDVTMTTGTEVAAGYGGFTVTGAFPVSVTPGGGASPPGIAEQFVFSYSDLGGAADLTEVNLLIGPNTALKNACDVVWARSDNSMRLYNDAASGYLHASAAGSLTFSNSQCSVSYDNPIVQSGNNLTMTLSITFSAAFLGTKNVYMEAHGTTSGDSGQQPMSTWNVAWLPMVTTVAPGSGHAGQTLASVAITGQNTNFAQGTTVAGFGAGITVNSMNVSSSTTATANISIAGNAAVGSRDVTMTTGAEVATGLGAFAVTGAYPASVTPIGGASSPGKAQSFVFTYSDGSGNADLAQVSILINSSTALTNACNVAWVRSTNTIRLYDDSDGGYLEATASGASTFGNSQCTLHYSNPMVAAGNNLTMTLSLTFASAFFGTQNVYMEARGTIGGESGLQLMGTWAVSLPSVASVAPNCGYQGQTLAGVVITGSATNFVQGTTVANFGPGITVNSLNVNSAVTATANITIAPTATLGANTVTMTTGSEAATLSGAFAVAVGYSLTRNVSPAGSGSITASPASSSGYYGSGTSVQLTAVPAPGYLFSNFSGDLTGSSNPQSVSMGASRSVAATFVLAAVVPNVAGMTQANATAAIANAGLVVGTVTTASSATVPAGNVISESPLAGTQENPGSAVNLVVSAGPVLLSITVTPANRWTVTGWTKQFTATGAYAGNATQDLTNQVIWASSSIGVATVSALGVVTGGAVGASTISAKLGAVSGSTGITVLAASKCDTMADGVTTSPDVQQILKEVLGSARAVDDLHGIGVVSIADVQIVINAVTGMDCTAK